MDQLSAALGPTSIFSVFRISALSNEKSHVENSLKATDTGSRVKLS